MFSIFEELPEQYVLLGRGTGPSEHRGNRYYRELISQKTNQYYDPQTSKAERETILQSVMDDIIVKRRGQFVRKLSKQEMKQISHKLPGQGGLLPPSSMLMLQQQKTKSKASDSMYVTVDYESAIEKTKQAFRYMQKKSSTGSNGNGGVGGAVVTTPSPPISTTATAKLLLPKPKSSSTKTTMIPLLPLLKREEKLTKPVVVGEMKTPALLPRHIIDPMDNIGGSSISSSRLIGSALPPPPPLRTTTVSPSLAPVMQTSTADRATTSTNYTTRTLLPPTTKAILDVIYEKQIAYEMAVISMAEAMIVTNMVARNRRRSSSVTEHLCSAPVTSLLLLNQLSPLPSAGTTATYAASVGGGSNSNNSAVTSTTTST